MAKYLLKLVESNEVHSIIEWDGITDLGLSPNYELELVTDIFTQYITEYTASTNVLDEPYNLFRGEFEGNLSGSISIDNEPLHTFLNRTNYGNLNLISGSDAFIENGYANLNGFITFDENDRVTSLTIPFENLNDDGRYNENYSGSINHILNNTASFNSIKLIDSSNTSNRIELVINDVVATNDNVQLNVIEQYNTLGKLGLNSKINWMIDFDFADSAKIGKFYGDFRGEINSEKLENVLGIAPKTSKSTKFKFSETVWDSEMVYSGVGGSIPARGYFMFNQDSSISGEYGESQWRNSKPTIIRINANSFDDSLESDLNFKNKLFDIIKNKYAGSKISMFQQLGGVVGVQAYKKFEIESAMYIERRIDSSGEVFNQIKWGNQDFIRVQDSLGYFSNFIDAGTKTEQTFADTGKLAFFEITVKQTGPDINYVYSEAPIQNQEFNIIVDILAIPTKQITMITQSQDYVVPSWAKKLTIYAVGAGGGGGAGSNGFGHHPGMGLIELGYVDPATGNKVIDNAPIADRFIASDFQEKIGHDVVTGGGGGAGGSIVVAEYDVKSPTLDNTALNEKIQRLTERAAYLSNYIGEQMQNEDGYCVECVEELIDELTEVRKELNEANLQLEQNLSGIPANSVLTVLVGSPGRGGKGRTSIEDLDVDIDLYRYYRPDVNPTYPYINVPVNHDKDSLWRSLWFQREYARIPNKINAVSVGTGLILRDRNINEIASELIIDFLMGKVIAVVVGSVTDVIDNLTSSGEITVESDIDYINRIASSSDDPIGGDISRLDKLKRYLEQIKTSSPGNTIDYDDWFIKSLLDKYDITVNDFVDWWNERAFEKQLGLSKYLLNNKFWASDASLYGIENYERLKKLFLQGYNTTEDIFSSKFKDFLILDYLDALNTGTDLLNAVDKLIYERIVDALKGKVNSDMIGNPISFAIKDWIPEFQCIDSYKFVSYYGSDFFKLSFLYTQQNLPNVMMDSSLLLEKYKPFIVYKDLLKLTHSTARQVERINYNINENGVSLGGGVMSFIGNVGINIGASALVAAIPSLGFLTPFISTAIGLGKVLYDVLADDDSVKLIMPISSTFDRDGLILINPHYSQIPKGFELSDPEYYEYMYHSSRRNGSAFYNGKHFHSPDFEEFNGKNGGDTEVYIQNAFGRYTKSDCILKASGGIGGTGGYAYRAILHPTYRAYGSNFETYSKFIVPGGYGSTQKPFAKKCISSTIVAGGPGAYGIASPTLTSWTVAPGSKYQELKQEYDEINGRIAYEYDRTDQNGNPNYDQEYINELQAQLNEVAVKLEEEKSPRIDFTNFSINQDTFKANVALSLPIVKTIPNTVEDYYSNPIHYLSGFYGKGSPVNNTTKKNTTYQIDGILYDLPSGIGIGVLGSSDKLDLEKYKKISENIMVAPPGGGGGVGVTWQLLDRRDTEYPYYYATNFKNVTDQYKLQSNILANNVYLGLGGQNLSTNQSFLFKDVDPTTNELIEIEIKNGGHGAFGNYYTTDGNKLLVRRQLENKSIIDRGKDADVYLPYVLAEDVSDRWGVGGGGGAAHYETDWSNRPNVGSIDISETIPYRDNPNASNNGLVTITPGESFFDEVQNGGDGGPGVVVIVAEP